MLPAFFLEFGHRIHNGRTREFLSRSIQQGGGLKGHSSVEDSVASLDLVKWFALNKKTKPVIVTVSARAWGASKGGGSGGGGGGDGAPPTTM